MPLPPNPAPFAKANAEPARRPGFMGGGELGEAVRAVFPVVPVGEGKLLRAPMVRSVVKREVLARLDEEPAPDEIASSAEEPGLGESPDEAGLDPTEAATAHPELPPPMPAEFVSPSALVSPPPPAAVDYAERLATGIAALRLTSERLAEQARTDALELGLLVARRILESELSSDVDRFFAVIRSVIRRAGESQRVVVRLHPEDAERIEAAGGARGIAAPGIAHVEVAVDADLQLGDCMVDADFGMVDGRLSTRLDEMRRLLVEAMAAEDP